MARDTSNGPIGIGPALRKAREFRGINLDQAARDTRLRPELLDALEKEDFDGLAADVYVRAALRTYADYLGVDPEQIARAYSLHAEKPLATKHPVAHPAGKVTATRLRDNHAFVWVGAAALLVLLIAVGALSRDGAPPPATLGTVPMRSTSPAAKLVDLVLAAKRDVRVSVTVDGERRTFSMRIGEERSFEGTRRIGVSVASGGSLAVTVDGESLGIQGQPGTPWSASWAARQQAEEGPH